MEITDIVRDFERSQGIKLSDMDFVALCIRIMNDTKSTHGGTMLEAFLANDGYEKSDGKVVLGGYMPLDDTEH